MRKYTFSLIMCCLLFMTISSLPAAEVKNDAATQAGNRVRITYDLIGDETDVEVELTVTVGGKEYKTADLHLDGDIGKVKPGKGKVIYWNILQDFPKGLNAGVAWEITAGGGKSFVDKVTGLKFVQIPAGTFMMGSRESAEETAKNQFYSDGELKADWFKNEHPRHQVTISQPFYMATTETTLAAFRKFIKETDYVTDAERQGKGYVLEGSGDWKERSGASWRNPGFAQKENHPVVLVSWNDAQAFVEWLNGKNNGPKYRLPTEAQWEYAARAGTQTPFFWGYKPSAAHANFGDLSYSRAYPGDKYVSRGYNDGYVHTAPVGSFKANPWGLYDMSGNAWEWCQDWYGDYRGASQEDPPGPDSGDRRVRRGGAWSNIAAFLRSAKRNGYAPDSRNSDIGFRLIRDFR